LQQNAKVRSILDEEARLRKAQDAALLRFALAKERAQIEKEEAQLAANRQAALGYKKYLEDQMKKDAEDTAVLDEMRRREEEKVWKARDDALKAREDARNYLMKLVDEGRQEQMRVKAQQLVDQKIIDVEWSRKFIKDAEEGVLREKQAAERRKQIAIENNMHLVDQINHRKEREEREKQNEYLENKHMERMERLHMQKLKEQGGVARTFRPLQASKWYS
jgi:hypothetical protein